MLALSVVALGACEQHKPVAKRPNVLFIAVDDLNDWVGALGRHPDALTPHIDKLAASGVLFENANCQAPLCGPSRASIMTGLLPSTTGIYQHIADDQIKKSSESLNNRLLLPEYFAANGYKTMGVGKLLHSGDEAGAFQQFGGTFGMFGPYPERRFKFDPEWFGQPKGTVTDWGAFPSQDESMPDYHIAQWAIDQLGQSHNDPFFLGVGFVRPHVPWYVPQQWLDKFELDSIDLPPYLASDFDDIPEIGQSIAEVPMMPTAEWAMQSGEWKAAVRAYLACMAFSDHYVGEVLRALSKSEYAHNTVVVLWSDHGYHLGEKNRFAKHSLWQRSTHVPLIFAGQGIPKNRKVEAAVGLIDMYPTLAELCGLPLVDQLDGHSLQPLIDKPSQVWPYAAITTYGENNHSVKQGAYNYISYEDGTAELYDHQTDPNEWYNLASDTAYASVVAELSKQLPQVNAPQVAHSLSKVNAYFRNKKLEEFPNAFDSLSE